MSFLKMFIARLKILLVVGLPYSTKMTATSNNNYRLLEKVTGYENRRNDVIFFSNRSPAAAAAVNRIVYYFGGDVQDLLERMNQSRENRQYQRWNLVSTGEILCRRFLDASIAVIRPNEMKDDTFSKFSNFVPSINQYGDPLSYDTTNLIGLQHLRALDEQLFQQTTSTSEITLVGFSKGCVVLNQLLHELTALHSTKVSSDLTKFASRIRRFIWLDGGHNNGEHVAIWPTNDELLTTLTQNEIDIEIYVTPFQINSSNPYKIHHTKQYRKFSELLHSRLANVRNYRNEMFFADQPASIEKHFELLTVF